MANKNLFKGKTGIVNTPVANTVNNAGGAAYLMAPRQMLAQIAATNTFNGTFYASADANLKLAKEAVAALTSDPEFIAKVAIYSRDKGYMKDMPAYLVAVLACLDDGKTAPNNDRSLFRKTFRKVIDNGKMLRNFVQIGRSGEAGKILNMASGTCRAAIQEWFNTKSPRAIFKASVGNDPTLKDILRMARPKPQAKSAKSALLAYLVGTPLNPENNCFEQKRSQKGGELYVAHSDPYENLPELIRQFENYRKTKTGPVPDVDFRMLTDLGLSDSDWKEVARNSPWTMTRMNLNTFGRHGVFKDEALVKIVADRLRNPEEIANAKAFPYQILNAYRAIVPPTRGRNSWMSTPTQKNENLDIPAEIQDALHDAMEVSVGNVPVIERLRHIATDVSGSMSSSITGHREGATSNVRCIDVAALYTTAMVRKNPKTKVYPFDHGIHQYKPEPRNTVITEANRLAEFGGGSTNCGLVLQHLNAKNEHGDVLFISDNESWVTSGYGGSGTQMMNEWVKYAGRNPGARLVCIDLTPRNNAQVSPRPDILQVGGFSDQVFDVIKSFLENGSDSTHWVNVIEAVEV